MHILFQEGGCDQQRAAMRGGRIRTRGPQFRTSRADHCLWWNSLANLPVLDAVPILLANSNYYLFLSSPAEYKASRCSLESSVRSSGPASGILISSWRVSWEILYFTCLFVLLNSSHVTLVIFSLIWVHYFSVGSSLAFALIILGSWLLIARAGKCPFFEFSKRF